eukprot:491428-Prorocentrum_minimum.AAC.1
MVQVISPQPSRSSGQCGWPARCKPNLYPVYTQLRPTPDLKSQTDAIQHHSAPTPTALHQDHKLLVVDAAVSVLRAPNTAAPSHQTKPQMVVRVVTEEDKQVTGLKIERGDFRGGSCLVDFP